MPNPAKDEIVSFDSAKALRLWFRKHHAEKSELWIQVFKKGTGVPSVTWYDIVLEALCWGWIDGVRKSLGAASYLQRVTPRKKGSAWSKRNTEHVERLIADGRMTKAGLRQVDAARADGRWSSAYAPASQMKVPEDFISAARTQPGVSEFYESLSKSSRYAIAYGLETAKKPETRQRRFDKFLHMLSRGEAPGFGFKKKTENKA